MGKGVHPARHALEPGMFPQTYNFVHLLVGSDTALDLARVRGIVGLAGCEGGIGVWRESQRQRCRHLGRVRRVSGVVLMSEEAALTV